VWGGRDCVGADDAEPAFTLAPDVHGVVLKTPDGRVVFRYMTEKPDKTNLAANSVCCFHPVNTPSGHRVTDLAPADHRHHRGVFLAWHAMTAGRKRADFWGWGNFAPTEGRVIENRSVKLAEADADHAVLEVRNDWLADGEVVIEEQLAIAARETQRVFVIDLDFRLMPKVDVKLDRTAFGGFCVKGRKEGKAKYLSPDGVVKLPPPHHLKPESDWPAADWYDYVLKLEDGRIIGIAVVDHPGNPPSTWHNLEPIAMVNPCIVAPGEVETAAGETLRLRYRLVVHDGPAPLPLLKQQKR
jgi:hypothetical protein